MEREVGGGIGMGNTCKPMTVSFQCMTKSTTNKKRIKIEKIKQKSGCDISGEFVMTKIQLVLCLIQGV